MSEYTTQFYNNILYLRYTFDIYKTTHIPQLSTLNTIYNAHNTIHTDQYVHTVNDHSHHLSPV